MSKRFIDEYKAFQEELEQYYATYPIEIPKVEARIKELWEENQDMTSYEKKACIYQAASELCEVHIFKHCSYFFEIQSGRARNGITAGFPPEPGIGGALMRKNNYMEKRFEDWNHPYNFEEDKVFLMMFFTDFSHYCVNADNFLKYGLKGILEQIRNEMEKTSDIREQGLLKSMEIGLKALIVIAHKFAKRAEQMMNIETDPYFKKRLQRIAEAAKKVPEYAPDSYYEALCSIWYMKEMMITMEGIGQAIVGHLDRLLFPYYERDLERGKIDREEAKDLLAEFLAITDSKWDIKDETALGGVNTTIVIGGCDEKGKIVFNEITQLICEIYEEFKLVDPKLQARISSAHPQEYFSLISKLAAKGSNVLSIFNDEVMIKAQNKMGRAIEDSRLYVGGGCQEPVTPNKELNVRAYCYINLPKFINDTIEPRNNSYWNREGLMAEGGAESSSFEEFYKILLSNMEMTFRSLVGNFNKLQEEWTNYSPCPLYSSTLIGCIENRKDMTEGGAQYNYSSLSPVGIGTFIDSLYAIKKVVFEEKRITLRELLEVLKNNFRDREELRQYLLNCVDKFGDDLETVNCFAKKIVDDIARISSGMEDARGGIYEPSLFSNLGYLYLRGYEATADGRRKGEILSRGMSPSDQGGASVITKIIHSMGALDLSNYPAGAVLYLDMPYTAEQKNPELYTAILKYFIAEGGNIMDINTVNVDELKDAKKNPDRYKNLVVRVWGFSAYFVTLTEELQDEIINRMIKK